MKKILNILLGIVMAVTVALLLYAIISGGSVAAIGMNLMWGYFLLVFAVLTALFCALLGMIKSPSGVRGTIVSLALIIVVIGVAYFVARGHTIQIPDIEAGGYFGHSETVLTDTSILVTYVALLGAFLTAVGTEIYGAFK